MSRDKPHAERIIAHVFFHMLKLQGKQDEREIKRGSIRDLEGDRGERTRVKSRAIEKWLESSTSYMHMETSQWNPLQLISARYKNVGWKCNSEGKALLCGHKNLSLDFQSPLKIQVWHHIPTAPEQREGGDRCRLGVTGQQVQPKWWAPGSVRDCFKRWGGGVIEDSCPSVCIWFPQVPDAHACIHHTHTNKSHGSVATGWSVQRGKMDAQICKN